MPATIKLGSEGPDVTKWQGLLSAAGFSVDVSGVFDKATEAATKAWQTAKSLLSDGIVGPQSWEAMTGQKQIVIKPVYAKNAKFGRDVLLSIWKDVTGEEPNLSELQIAQAQAQLESAYGKASYTNKQTGETSGVINNWGAVQAGKPPCDPAKAFEASDSGAEGWYSYCYKKYATPEEGARHFLEHMTVKRPTSWALMKTGDIDAWALQMHLWTPPLEKLGGGKPPGAKQNVDPINQMPGYFEQPPGQRALGIEERIWAIADALGEPVAAKRGGPYEAPGTVDFLPSLVPKTPAQKGFLTALLVGAAGTAAYFAYRYYFLRR